MEINSAGNFINTRFLKKEVTVILIKTLRSQVGVFKGHYQGTTKFVEMVKLPISLKFPMKDFFTDLKGCQYALKCNISEEQDCRVSRGIYRIICKTCEVRDGKKYVYTGTIGFSIHKRMMEHLQCVRARNALNALGERAKLHHKNEEAELVTEIIQEILILT